MAQHDARDRLVYAHGALVVKHALAGFGGGPNDIPSCQSCGAVAPESADSGCTGPALFDWQHDADADEVWNVRYEVTGYDGSFSFGPYTREHADAFVEDLKCFEGVHSVEVVEAPELACAK
jgi:hypothetical protein